MLSTALFSSHHGRFQPGKSPKSNKNISSTSKSNGHLAADYDAQVPTLCRFVKFDTTANFIPNSPITNSTNEDIRRDSYLGVQNDANDAISEPESTTDRHFNDIPEAKSDTLSRRRTNSFFRQNRPSALRRSSTSSKSSQKSSVSSILSEKLKSNSNNYSHYQSCPDLLKPCFNRHSTSYESSLNSTLSRHKFSKSEKNLLKQKIITQWSLDDVLTWLQSVGLEDVTSVLIGYDITGNDVLMWNDDKLESLGIVDQSKRQKILNELQKLKFSQTSSNRNSPKKQSSQRQCSLFSMIRMSQYDRIKVIELPPTTSVRDFTVATDPMEMALVVTSSKSVVDLKKGDLIIELNGVSCIKLAPVDFNKLLHELGGHKYQMVVLRKTPMDSEPDLMSPKIVSATKSLNIFHL